MSEASSAQFQESLKEELDSISHPLTMADDPGLDQVLAGLGRFRAWTSKAKALLGTKAEKELNYRAKQLEEGLKAGRALNVGLERTLQLILETTQKLNASGKEEKIDPKDPVPQPVQSSPKNDIPLKGEFVIPAEDHSAFKEFTHEVPEYIESIESNLLALSRGENWDVMNVYRPFHTLKGVCGFMNLPALSKVAHEAESLLSPYKEGTGRPTESQIDLLLQVADVFRRQVEQVQKGLSRGRFELVGMGTLLEDLTSTEEGESSKIASAPGKTTAGLSVVKRENSIRIPVEKMDSLLEAVGELAICQTQVTEGIQAAHITGHVASESERLGKISRMLQDLVLSLRMVPVESLFLRMNRLVRDLSQKMGKPLRLELSGGETELDKGVAEELAEPLVHLLRNAVDHGLESVEKRSASGKQAEGCIRLQASRDSGDFILKVQDDGGGLDLEKLEQKGRALGLIPEDKEVTEAELAELIFAPNFSTASEVSEVSGRGIGMEMVKRKVEYLRGSVSIDTRPGQGTTFTLRIPITITLMDGILVRIRKQRYVVPAYYVRQMVEVKETQRHQIGAGPKYMHVRDENIPLVDIPYWLACEPALDGRPILVVLERGGRQAGLVVDEVLGKKQVVVKQLGETLDSACGIAGGAVLGDGRVGLILDVDAFLREKPAAYAAN
jgi:two-component system chemotaxis sensor kinase CheA